MVRVLAVLVLTLLVSGQALGADIGFTSAISQGAFNSLSKEAGVALAYKNVAPPHPLGVTGFDIGVEAEAVDINKESAYWNAAFNNDAPSYLVLPKLRVRKGLPFGIDVGGMYSNVPDSNIQLYGAEVSKSILDGGAATPALGVRATYTRLAGLNDLDIQTYGVDASIGKGILFLTPYVGGGYLWVNSKASGDLQRLATAAGAPLRAEKLSLGRVFAGVEIKPFPLFRITGEFEYAIRPIYSLKAAIGF
ncbi:hypothetical protein [Geomobilimonas luticola]|uniref:Outer membrane protein beta-barrel domain-containing protein n=1 Tax=Geomobilimonas luticola TaxID=1114878 RepID=A0ABS5SBA9_9BACT|nr:hypothetical protein [Geomobilimonas luticola]MBT0652654.1 hypothetical protein [Geomobilimonas luticola]